MSDAFDVSKLIYITNTSLDGYIEDETGDFNWLHSDEVFQFITELVRPIGTYLYGRRLYETMAYWNAAPAEYPADRRDFARTWQKAEKVVFSRTLHGVSTANTRVERDFDVEAIAQLKRTSDHDITIGGAALAARAFDADLVDECRLFVNSVFVGAGKPAFHRPLRRNLKLRDVRRFGDAVIYLRYDV